MGLQSVLGRWIAKCGNSGLQSVLGFELQSVAKWITKCVRDYKVWQGDYKVHQGLQSVAALQSELVHIVPHFKDKSLQFLVFNLFLSKN